MADFDVAIVGGGLLGSAFGWGLARAGTRCVVFDEGDTAIRTARGNFGLVWVQSKGQNMPAYASWSLRASLIWTDFAAELRDATGIDLQYVKGAYDIAADEQELDRSIAGLKIIQASMGDDAYDFEVLDHKALKSEIPLVGSVPGATYTEHDGHCNPLLLLRALHQDMQAKGTVYRPNCPVGSVKPLADGSYQLLGRSGQVLAHAGKVIVSAGHGSRHLTEPLGIDLPVHADQGQIMVTEKVAPVMKHASTSVRQTDNGSFLLGPSSKDVGYDTRTDLKTLAAIASRCITIFPFLGSLRLQRAWGALRVMTPDGNPVYQQSEAHPGVFSFACHSGVTLAALHSLEVANWVIDGAIPAEFEVFHPRRFNV
ncbi:MAG: FAD-binding oxidoreductase [Rhodobacteraceae bacterium]|nr:FAD-binding oxidoreductase [Paracoccaceae bacterium]